MKKALIIGNGRAGQRHARLLRGFDITPYTVDPNRDDATFRSTPEAVLSHNSSDYDFAVVASPPGRHLHHIQLCLDAGLPVLCEKPLCGFLQLNQAEVMAKRPDINRVGFAFNYRFHPALALLKRHEEQWRGGVPLEKWACNSDQYRPDLPGWGLLLDHLGHSIDILRWLSGDEVLIDVSESKVDGTYQASHYLTGFLTPSLETFTITDRVRRQEQAKQADVRGPWGVLEVRTDPATAAEMFDTMYRVFFNHLAEHEPFPVTFAEALKVQYTLNQAWERQWHRIEVWDRDETVPVGAA